MSVKIAVFAPMPSASERMATAANRGLRRRPRSARRKSEAELVMLLFDGMDPPKVCPLTPQNGQRVEPRRSNRRHEARHERNESQQSGADEERQRVGRAHAENELLEQAGGQQRRQDPRADADESWRHPLAHDEPEHVARPRAEGSA